MTNKEINHQKRNFVHQAIASAMTLLEQSEFKQTELWPKYFTIEWHPKEDDHFTIAARIDDDINSKRLILNSKNQEKFESRMIDQLKAIELILDHSVENNIKFEHQEHSILGLDLVHIMGQITFKFTIL